MAIRYIQGIGQRLGQDRSYATVRRKIMLRILILTLTEILLVSTALAQNNYDESQASDHQNNLMCNHSKFLKCTKLTKEKCIEAFVKTEN